LTSEYRTVDLLIEIEARGGPSTPPYISADDIETRLARVSTPIHTKKNRSPDLISTGEWTKFTALKACKYTVGRGCVV